MLQSLPLILLLAAVAGCSSDESAGGAPGTGGSGGSPTLPAGGSPGANDWPELEGHAEATLTRSDLPGDGEASCLSGERVRELSMVPVDANATASATLARALLGRERPPIPSRLRTPEFLAYYAPELGAAQAPEVIVESRPTAIPSVFELMIGVQAPPLSEPRPPLALTLLVDDSSSMAASAETVRAFLTALAPRLVPETELYWLGMRRDSQPERIAPSELAERAESYHADVAESDAAFDAALVQAYGVPVVEGAYNRLLVISDGEHHPTLDSRMRIKSEAMERRLIAAVGVSAEQDLTALRVLSHDGRGPFVYIDGARDAEALAARTDELFGVALDDLKIELIVPEQIRVERAYGFELAPASEAAPQLLAPGTGFVFPVRLKGVTEPAPILVVLHYTNPESGLGDRLPFCAEVPSEQTGTHIDRVFAVLAYAEALRTMDAGRLELAWQALRAASSGPGDPLEELVELLPLHPAFPK
jgi:hypothetical protein